MALSVKVGTWTGNGTTSQGVTGVGFQPKALIVLQIDTTNDDAFAANARMSVGFATRRGGTTQQKSVSVLYNDNIATTAARSQWADGIVAPNSSASTVTTTLTTFDSDGFTVAYANNSSAEYTYMAIGGSDLTDACVVEDDWPTSGATFDVIGAGFTPDAAIYLTGPRTTDVAESNIGRADIGFGCFAGSAQWSQSTTADDGVTMTLNNNSVFSSDSCITLLGNNSDTVDAKGIFSAFTSDGATITNTNAPTTALRIFALYLQGGQYKAGSKAKASTASADSFTFNTPTFTPTGVLLGQAVGTASNTVITATMEMTIGGASATDGTAEAYAGYTANETLNTQSDEIKSATKAIAELTPGATPAVDAAGDMTAFASGSFTLTWDAAGTAALVGFLAMGNAAVVTDEEPALIGGKLVRNSLLLRHMVH